MRTRAAIIGYTGAIVVLFILFAVFLYFVLRFHQRKTASGANPKDVSSIVECFMKTQEFTTR